MIRAQLNSDYLKDANEAYYHIFSSVLYDGFCYCELNSLHNVVLDKKLKTLLGYDDTSDLTLEAIIYVEDLALITTILSTETKDGEIAKTKELRLIKKSGEMLFMECQIYSKKNKNDNSQIVFAGFKELMKPRSEVRDTLLRRERNDEILKGAAIGTWQYNLISHELFWNESFYTLLGYKLEEIKISKCDFWQSLTHMDDFKKSQHLIKDHIAKNSSYFRYESRMKHKNGNWIWVLVIGKILNYTESNQPDWLGGIAYDITDKKNGELLALKYEDILQRVNQAAEIGVWEVDLLTRKMACSEEIKKMFGVALTFDPSLDDAIDFIKEGTHREKLISAIDNAINEGTNYDIELEAIDVNGNSIWVRSIGLSEFSDGVCTRFYGFIQNINQKALANKELAVKEELFRKTFLYAPFGMAITDINGKISQSNKNLADFFGYSKEVLLGTTINEFSHPQDKYVAEDLINDLLIGKKENFTVDQRYIHKDSSIIWAQISISSLKDELGNITNFVIQLENITERKNNEALLLNYKDLLERSNFVAKIGSWEIDLLDNTVSWSQSLSSIVNTRENIAPTFEDSISHLIDEQYQDLIRKALKDAQEFGENFDLQLRIKDTVGVSKWIRMIGISEFFDGTCQRLYGLIQDINDIKQAQYESANQEELWRTTFNHANAGIALINFDGQPYNVNQSVCEIFGYTIEEMQDIRIKDISLPEELNSNIARMNELINSLTTNFSTDIRFLHKDKHIIWTNVTVSAVRNDYNHFTHMVAQVIDITKSKTNELLLEKYKEILERSNEVAKIGSWEFNPQVLELKLSNNLHKLLGKIEISEVYECEFINNYILDADQKYINLLIEDAIQNGENFDVEIELKTAFGQRWMRLIAISDFENNNCKLLHGLLQDIHEIKTAQMEIQLREQEFRQSFWYASTGMALIDLEGKIVRANPSLCDTLGYTVQELIEIDKIFLSNKDDAVITASLIGQLARGERESFEQEKRYFHKNQKVIWAILSMSTVKNDKGETTHYVALVTDITDKKLLTESLKEHNNRLQNYAHIVSHNLRSHTGNLMMLLELSEIDDEQKIDQELFDHIKSAASNMTETVSHLSEIVEIQNLIKNTLVAQNLEKRVLKALENVQATITQINGKVTVNVSENLMVYAIPSYLDSIILNILTNAIKYRSQDRLLNIEITAENENGCISLSFTDNGLGIDLERYGSKIFGMYKTFHDHKDARGIGLFMTKNQLEAMGGGIEVQSKIGVGSTFKIYFKNENN